MSAMAPEQAIVELEAWEQRRQSGLEALETARSEWSELKSLLGARTFDELSEARDAAEKPPFRAPQFTESEVTALAAGDPVRPSTDSDRTPPRPARPRLLAKGLRKSEPKTGPVSRKPRNPKRTLPKSLRWLQSLDGILATTQRFIAEAQERVQRDLAPVLAANLRRGVPPLPANVTSRHHDIETLEVQVCGVGDGVRQSLSQGTAEQVYICCALHSLDIRLQVRRRALAPDDVTVI